jgi:putative proteasome-type protease
MPLDEAAKCALISMDSTLKSNISVGLPLDLLVYEADTLRVTKFVHIDGANQYMAMIRATWGSRLKQVFAEIPDPTWFDSYVPPGAPRLQTEIGQPVRAPLPPFVEAEAEPTSPIQLVAGQATKKAAR